MEEKSIIQANPMQLSMSEWKVRHNLYQTTRNYKQLQNRINILELQKKKKLKEIENKLSAHKKLVENKIYKHQLRSAIQAWTKDEQQKQNSNSRLFHTIKESRRENIRRKQDELFETKHRMFEYIKSLRKQNEKKIGLSKLQSLEKNVNKRNKVRLIQIGCKQNIEGFWNSRLESFQQDKKLEVSRKLKQHDQSLKKLQKLQRNEESLLQEIKRAQCIEQELTGLIQNEKSMDGSQLNLLYLNKVIKSVER